MPPGCLSGALVRRVTRLQWVVLRPPQVLGEAPGRLRALCWALTASLCVIMPVGLALGGPSPSWRPHPSREHDYSSSGVPSGPLCSPGSHSGAHSDALVSETDLGRATKTGCLSAGSRELASLHVARAGSDPRAWPPAPTGQARMGLSFGCTSPREACPALSPQKDFVRRGCPRAWLLCCEEGGSWLSVGFLVRAALDDLRMLVFALGSDPNPRQTEGERGACVLRSQLGDL